jgi:hypothetical protein
MWKSHYTEGIAPEQPSMAIPTAMIDGLVIAQDGTVGYPGDSTNTCAQRFKGAELKGCAPHLSFDWGKQP